MKKNILSVLVICAALLGCQKNEISETRPYGVEIHATIEDDASTKTVMDENNNIRWSEGDQIIAFMKSSYGHKYQVKSSFIGETYADFSKVSSSDGDDLSVGTEWGHIVAYYPYAESIKCAKSGNNYALNVILPSEQTYAAESFGNGFFPMVAVSENNNITFKNVLGGMKLQLRGIQKVKSIKLEGKNNETLSGAAVVTAYTDGETKPAITMSDAASTSVTLSCDFGVQLSESTATEFIIALPPVLFSKGFTMTVIDDAGNEQTIETDKENSVLRSSLLVMPEVTLDKVPQPDDYIDEYGINHGQGVKIGDTVWAPVNCGYHKDNYKYGKLYQWGRKYGQGYDGDVFDSQGHLAGTYSDSTSPMTKDITVSAYTANEQANSNIFYYGNAIYFAAFMGGNSYWYWDAGHFDGLWNSGTESMPVKKDYDPCPDGWRVPTIAELEALSANCSSLMTDAGGNVGCYFSGSYTYSEDCAKIFLPFAGMRSGQDALAKSRGRYGRYWSSASGEKCRANYLDLSISSDPKISKNGNRADGYSVRCVRDNSPSVPEQEVELVCVMMNNENGTKSIGFDNGNLYLTGDDFVDVNGAVYPIEGNGTKTFVVKVPKADSYTVSYPAGAVKVNTDGTYSVKIPDEYVGSSFGVFIGKVADEALQCNLEAICGIVRVDVSAYVDWDRMEFESICGSAMWGNAVLLSDYSVHAVSEGESMVTVKRSGDDQYVFMPTLPASVNGIAVTMYNKAGDILIEERSDNAFTFKRGMMYSLGRL